MNRGMSDAFDDLLSVIERKDAELDRANLWLARWRRAAHAEHLDRRAAEASRDALIEAGGRVDLWEHHRECDPLRHGCRCGLWDFRAALARERG